MTANREKLFCGTVAPIVITFYIAITLIEPTKKNLEPSADPSIITNHCPKEKKMVLLVVYV